MVDSVLTAVLNVTMIVMIIGSVVFAAVLGGRCERIGALIYGGGSVVGLLCQRAIFLLNGETSPILVFVIFDLGMAAGLGALALKYPNKLWPGVAACAQFFVFTFSASQLVNFPLSEWALLHACHIAALLVQVTLIAGAWQARWGKPRRDEWEEFAAALGESALPRPT